MSGWRRFEKVEITDVYQKLPVHWNQYKLTLCHKKGHSWENEYFEVVIQDHQFLQKIQRLLNKETEREYFAFGMQDIDIFFVNGTFAIDYSPFEASHDVFVLKKGELRKLADMLAVPVNREQQLERLVKKMLEDLNASFENGEVIFPWDWNKDLKNAGIEEQLEEDAEIVVNQII